METNGEFSLIDKGELFDAMVANFVGSLIPFFFFRKIPEINMKVRKNLNAAAVNAGLYII